MSFVVSVTLVRAAFHGRTRSGDVQWPPDPVRLLGALKSGAHALDDTALSAAAHSALNRLVEAPPPTITTPHDVLLGHPATYTDRTGLPERISAKYEERPGRLLTLAPFDMDSSNRDAKSRDGVALDGHRIDFEIDLDLPPDEIQALDAAARHIAYFGRSEDAAVVEVLQQPDDSPTDDDRRVTWYPFDTEGGSRGWQPNTIEWMDECFSRVFANDPVVSSLPSLPPTGYVRPLTYRTVGPQADRPLLHIVRLPEPKEQQLTPSLLRRLHPLIPTGWKALPLTASSHPNSDGHLLGLGLYPCDDADMTVNPSPDLSPLRDELGVLPPVHRQLTSLLPETWVGPARHWTSTTPLRGFPQLMVLEDALKREADKRFGIDVVIVEASTQEQKSRDHRWANSAYTDGFGLWWVTVDFAQPVVGPLQLGSSTEHGFGAFLPRTEEESS